MKLTSFRVQRFRNILDSTEVAVDPAVTCLVGKNESGKTGLLHALWRTNPHVESAFAERHDYPRWQLNPDRKAGIIHEVRPITATFALDDKDVAAVEAVMGPNVLTSTTFQHWISYDSGDYGCVVEVDERAAVTNLIDAVDDLDPRTKSQTDELADVRALRKWLKERRTELSPEDEDQARLLQDLDSITASLKQTIPEDWWSAKRRVHELLMERMPTFFYFGEYQTLPGRIDLRELEAPDELPGATSLQTARALLKLAGTDVTLLGDDEYEDRKAELEAVSGDLTRQVFTYWKQNPDLSVEIDIDKETVVVPTPQGQQSLTAVARFLDLRVKDRRHNCTNNFGQR